MIYRDAELEYAAHGDDVTCVACEVILDGDRVVLSYEEETSFKIYEGREQGPGHYRVQARDGDGSGSLHRFPEDACLEGSWAEAGFAGWWQVTLGPAGAAPD